MASTKAIEGCVCICIHARVLGPNAFPLCGLLFEMTAACGHFRHAFTSLSDTKALTIFPTLIRKEFESSSSLEANTRASALRRREWYKASGNPLYHSRKLLLVLVPTTPEVEVLALLSPKFC